MLRVSPLHAMTGAALAAALLATCRGEGYREVTALTPETHARFPISAGPHARDCNVCHGAFDTFREFDCLTGCHQQAETESNHASVSGYAYDSARCYDCHPDGAASYVDHTDIFPITAADTHGSVQCADCHRGPDRQIVTCAAEGCHGAAATNGAHGAVGGYSWSSPKCLQCHADSQVDRVSAHLPFHIGAGYEHYRESCLACHNGRRGDRPYPATDFASLTCAGSGCHSRAEMDGQHDELSGYAYEPRTCIASGCHRDGTKP